MYDELVKQLRELPHLRYGIVPKKYDLRKDIERLGLDKSEYQELYGKEMDKD